MAKVITDNSNYTNIANAIREKNGLSTTYKPNEMPQAILDITSGDVEDSDLTPFTFSNSNTYIYNRITSIDCSKGNFLPTGNNYGYLFANMPNLTEIKNFSIPSNVTDEQVAQANAKGWTITYA